MRARIFTVATVVLSLAPAAPTNAAFPGLNGQIAYDKLRVYDGGPDGDADTDADNSLFAVQGMFVP